MCTVTFIARRHGYALGMNRDEKLTRTAGHPPRRSRVGPRELVCPSEPGGGTWIGLNDLGITLALINWYSVAASIQGEASSRGCVIPSTLAASAPEAVSEGLHDLPLDRIRPFRLIGVFPGVNAVCEWRWNGSRLAYLLHGWKAATWISSGFDEPGAQLTRGQTFAQAVSQPSFGQVAWIRRLHRSHGPERGPYSTCMHRADAATVSYTEVVVRPRTAVMLYRPGPPCGNAAAKVTRVSLFEPRPAIHPAATAFNQVA